MTTTVLIGPKTRLAREIVALAGGEPVLAVARDADDAAALPTHPGLDGVTVVDGAAGDLTARVGDLGSGPVRLVITALGPLHPETPQTSYDAASVVRDLEFVRQVIATDRPTQVVYVSTILALAPGDDRRYYGGWKGIIEEQVQQFVDDRNAAGGHATMSVLYPGRLLDAADRKGRLRLHTSYARLARVTLAAAGDTPSGRPVGIDSRFWLCVRSISFALRSLKPATRRSVPLPPRLGGRVRTSPEGRSIE